jgi:energy-coupling factor transporter ATP-binding protein EcfA2
MRLRNVAIENYRSLEKVSLEGLEDLTILIGENGSGKTSLLEALELFFSQFSPETTTQVKGTSDYLWFNRDTKRPIRFELLLELSPQESDSIMAGLGQRPGKSAGTAMRIVRLLRAGPQGKTATWETQEVEIGERALVREGAPVPVPGTKPKAQTEGDKPEGDVSPAETTTESETSEGPGTLIPGALAEIEELLKGCFTLVRSVRHKAQSSANVLDRDTLLPDETCARIGTLLGSDEVDEMRLASMLKDAFSLAVPQGIDSATSGLRVREGDLWFPVKLVGGGTQEYLGLLLEVLEGSDIVAIEEPELHLHPRYERILLNFLRSRAKTHQVIIATHSEVFVDAVDPRLVWAVRKPGKKSIVERAGDVEGVSEILAEVGYQDIGDFFREVGARPSTVYMHPRLLLVNREIDKTLLPLFAAKLGIDFEAMGVAIEALSGIGAEEHHLKVWAKLTKGSKANVVMVVGSGAKAVRDKLFEKKPWLLPEERVVSLEKPSLLDYIPEVHLKSALRKEPFRLASATVDAIELKPPASEAIEAVLREKQKSIHGWEYRLCRKALEEMSVEEIGDDLRKIIERAQRLLQQPMPQD